MRTRAACDAPEFRQPDLQQRSARRCSASGDICSKRWIWEQYDYMVRTNTIAGPGGDAAIVRIKETGTSVAMSLDGNGRYCYSRSARRREARSSPSAAAICRPSARCRSPPPTT